MGRKCYECKKAMLKFQKITYDYHGIKLGRFPAEVCQQCKEQFFSSETSGKIEQAAKKAGVWGLCTTTNVGRSGNALDIRINKRLANFVGLTKGKEVLVHPEGKKRLVVELR